MESLALGFEPCFSSLSPGWVTPEWVCTQVLNFCFLPSCLCWRNQTTISRNHCPSWTSAFSICDKWEYTRVFQMTKMFKVAFLFDRLCSSCFSEVVIFSSHILLLLNLLLRMWPLTFSMWPLTPSVGCSARCWCPYRAAPTPWVMVPQCTGLAAACLTLGKPHLSPELSAIWGWHLESSPVTWLNTFLFLFQGVKKACF